MAYRVTDIRVIDPDDFSVFGIEAGKDEVSLLTCTPYGVNTRRLVVTGERVDIPDPAPAPDDVPLARPGWWLLAAIGRRASALPAACVAMALTGAMVLAAVPAGLAAAAAPAYVSAALSKVADGTGHGTPNQTFVNAANGFEVGDNAPDDGVVSSGDLVLYRLDLGFTAASVNVGAFPEGTSWLLVAGSGEDSSSWPLTVTDGMLRLPRISGDARLEWTLPASVLTDDWERGETRTFDIQVIPDEDAFAADDAHLLNLGMGGEPGRAQGRDVDSRNDDYGSLTGYPYPNNDWSRAIPGTPVEASIGALQWMGWEHIMMLQDDGTIVGWGNNSHTVLGGTQSQDPSQPVTVEARGSQATPATDPTAQDVAPVSERNETRADGGRDVVRAYTLPAAVAPGGRVVLLAGAGVLLRRS